MLPIYTYIYIYIYIYIHTLEKEDNIYPKDFIVPIAATLHRLRYECCKIGH